MTDYDPSQATVPQVEEWAATADPDAKAAALAVETAGKNRAGAVAALSPTPTPPPAEPAAEPAQPVVEVETVADVSGFREGDKAPHDLYLTFENDGSRRLVAEPVPGGRQVQVAIKGVEVAHDFAAGIHANAKD